MKNTLLTLILVATNAASAFAQGAAALPLRIGTAAAVHGLVKAAAPSEIGRIVESGKPLFLNDHVTTGGQGRLQILLADETVFTIGPNADMVLDKFVYDPTTGQGSVAAQIVRGAFRFVSGRIAHQRPESMKVRLNVGTIGIRGTVVVGETDEKGSLVINAGAGGSNDANEPPSAIDVTNAGATVGVYRTGEGVRFTRDGAPSKPAPMGAELDRLSRALGSAPTGKQASRQLLQEPASKVSRQWTSRGWAFADQDQMFDQLASNAASDQIGASQFNTDGGIATWQEMSQIAGSAVYSGAGTYTCTGGSSCATPITGNVNFSLNINFSSRQLTSGTINILTASSASGTVLSDTGNISAQALPSAGNAVLTPANISGTGGFLGTNFKFLNSGGVTAKEVQMNLSYTNSSFNAGSSFSGSAAGSR